MLFTAHPASSIQQTLLAAKETRNSTPAKGISLLATEEEEVTRKSSGGILHPGREEEIVERRSEGSSHSDKGEDIVETFLSPKDKISAIKATQTLMIKSLPVEPVEIPSEYWSIFMAPTTSTIDFPIGDLGTGAQTKPIPLTTLPSFHGLTSEDPNMFLFEFDIVCRGYD